MVFKALTNLVFAVSQISEQGRCQPPNFLDKRALYVYIELGGYMEKVLGFMFGLVMLAYVAIQVALPAAILYAIYFITHHKG